MSSSPAPSSPLIHRVPAGRRWHLRFTLTRALLGVFPSVSLNRTRLLAMKACGIRMGPATLFLGFPKLKGRGSTPSRLQIGAYCGFNDGCVFDLTAPISIGNHVSVGHEVRFLTSIRQAGVESAAPITVGDGVWLGARCILMGGVTVGAGTVISAGVTVSADVPPNTLMTGAKPISLAKWR
jgi:maltose O-acetyltransferase